MAITSADKIVVAGQSGTDTLVARFDVDGALEASGTANIGGTDAADFLVTGSTCPTDGASSPAGSAQLAARASCVVSVVFQPTALGTRVAQLERQLATQTNEAEIMGRRIADMEMRLTEQARVLADRERERDQLRVDVDAARRIEADLRQELGTIERRLGTATDRVRATRNSIVQRLSTVQSS